jgi:glutamate racemase
VIGTRGTIGSGAYAAPHAKACPLLVPFIEEGEIDSDALKLVVRDYLAEFKNDDLDVLILGCTHYPIIRTAIEKEMNNNIQLIDPGVSVAQELKDYLAQNNLLNSQKELGARSYFVTDYTERFVKTAEMFLGHKIEGSLKNVTL